MNDDSRGEHVRQDLAASLLSRRRTLASLDDARTTIVDVVDAGISKGVSPRDLNHLDAARVFINRAIELEKAAASFTRNAQHHVALAFSDNVVEIGTTPEGVA